MKIPDFKPLLVIPYNQREVYVGKEKGNFLVEYLNSLDTEGEIIKKTFTTWEECKNYLLAENFIKFKKKESNKTFKKLNNIDKMMRK